MTIERSMFLYALTRDQLAKATEASSYILRVITDTTTEDLPFPASGSLTTGRWYWMIDDGQADASTYGGVGALMDMLLAALNANTGGGTYALARAVDGKVTITCDVNAQLQWSHANTTLSPLPFGYAAGVDAPLAKGVSIAAPNTPLGMWSPGKTFRDGAPARTQRIGAISETLNGAWRASDFGSIVTRRVSWAQVPRAKIKAADVAADDPYGAWETAWDALSLGRPLRLYGDDTAVTSADYELYRLAAAMGRQDPHARDERDKRLTIWQTGLELVQVAA